MQHVIAFRAMNTDVTVISSDDDPAVAERVRATFAAAEHRFSRFLEGSELWRLNRADGPFAASRELIEVLARARSHAELTGGLFDPGVGSAVLALGYDRSFAPGMLDRAAAHQEARGGRFLDVALDMERCIVTRPPHVHIDLGGMAKGTTVDRAAALLGPSGAIDAGGDAFLRGSTPEGEPWLVEVEDPRNPSDTVATVAVCSFAVATSAGNRRRWRVGGQWVHHLIDPRTQASAAGDLLQATVFAPTTELADVLAKTAFLLGRREGSAFLERQTNVGAVLVPRSGTPVFVGNLDVREVGDA
jgi:FAD:protein FMN transferase